MEEDLDPAADSLSLDDSTFQYHHAQSPVQPQQPRELNNSSSSTERSQSWLDSESVGSSEAESDAESEAAASPVPAAAAQTNKAGAQEPQGGARSKSEPEHTQIV